MKTNKPVTKDNIQGQDILGPSNQVNFPSNSNCGRPSQSTLPMEIQVDNIDHVIVQDENKTKRRFRQCKINTIYIFVKCQVQLHANRFEQFHTK